MKRALLSRLGFAAVVGASLAASTIPALASQGCTAVNAGVFDVLGSGSASAYQSNFDAGDQITITSPQASYSQYSLTAYGYNSTILATVTSPTGPWSRTVTVPANQTSLQRTFNSVSGPATYTHTCVPAGASTGSGSDSDKARAVQSIGSRIAARGSMSAITDAAQGGIAGQLGAGSGTSAISPTAPPAGLGGPVAEPVPGQIGNLGHGTGVSPSLPRGQLTIGNFHLWSDVRATGILDSESGATGFRGQQVNVTSGVGMRLSSTMVVGALTAFEHFNYDFGSLSGNLKGDGYTGGVYLGTKLNPNSWFNLVGTYTRLNYDVGAGTAAGSFDGDRWMVSGTLGTRVELPIHQLFAEPTLGLVYLREMQSAWADSLGVGHTARSFDEGRFSAGTKIGTTWVVPGAVLTPYVGAYADYYFGTSDGLPTGIDGIGLNHNWSMRAVAGIGAQVDKGTSLNLGATLGGIGDTVQTMSVRGGYSVRF